MNREKSKMAGDGESGLEFVEEFGEDDFPDPFEEALRNHTAPPPDADWDDEDDEPADDPFDDPWVALR